MNLILLFKEDFVSQDKVRLSDRRHNHILRVLRASVGDEVNVGILNGRIGKGKIASLDDKYVELDIALDADPPEKLPITLILALPRPIVLSRVLISVTALGVKKIILLNSYRVEKSFWQSHMLREENLKRHLMLGLEQAKDTVMPEILLRDKFKPFVEDELPSIIHATMPIVAHPKAAKECFCDVRCPVTLAVGPEGGFIPYEIDKFVEWGFTPVRLGHRILNIETAVSALIGRLF